MKTSLFRLALALGIGVSWSAQAQYVGESVYYSRLQFGGPARTQGIAGANVALGADFGNLSSNPAGLGLFRKSEFNFSPGLGLGSADATATNADGTLTKQNDTKNSFHIASLGLAFTNRKADDDASSDWRGGSFALGFSRLADFNTSFRYSGQVADNKSLFQRLREPSGAAFGTSGYNAGLTNIDNQATDGNYVDLDGLAYGAVLTSFGTVSVPARVKDPNKPASDTTTILGSKLVDNIKTTSGLERNSPVNQSETVTRKGSVSQLDFGYGGSYKDRLFVGGAIGIVSSNSRTTRDFTETANPLDVSTSFGSLRLSDDVKTEGTGVNLRIGVIYRLNDVLRFGGSVQTPTYIQFTDTYSTTLTTQYSKTVTYPTSSGNQTTNGETVSAPSGQYAYTLTTPFRANGGIALTLGKRGFITSDIEYVGYQQARFHNNESDANGDTYSFATENQGIKDAYQNAVNVRIGAEIRASIFRLRAGYAHYGDPYRGSTVDRAQEYYTGGIGFRNKDFFLDLAGVYTTVNQQYSPYTLVSRQQPLIDVNAHRYTTTVTAGFTF